MVDPVGLEVVARGVFGAEIVDGDLYPEFPQLGQHVVAGPFGLGQGGLGHVEFQVGGGQSPFGDGCADIAHQFLAALDLGQREVDRDQRWGHARIAPLAHLPAGLFQHPMAERHYAAGSFRDVDEHIGGEQAAGGVIPAHQRLHAENSPG
ncbi:hypothetical protein D3C84_842780 [compost metagenome]